MDGTIGDGPLTLCEDHLMTPWLTSGPALADHIARRPRARPGSQWPGGDPHARLEAEAALRAMALRDRAPGPG